MNCECKLNWSPVAETAIRYGGSAKFVQEILVANAKSLGTVPAAATIFRSTKKAIHNRRDPGPQNFEFPPNPNSEFIPPTRSRSLPSQNVYLPGAVCFAHKPCQLNPHKGAFTYDVSSRGGGGFEMLTVADKGGSKPC